MSHDDPSTKDATKKYHQIVVPDHALKPDTSGTSFLRTGTFPSLTDTTKQPPGFRESLELARLAGDHHLKTGGSWHHVDGNRIETTTGRKVEVIAGSYVAHRGPGNSPGPNFSATWATTSYTQVGSEDLPVGWSPAIPASSGQPAQPAQPPATSPVDPSGFASTLSFPFSAGLEFNPPAGGTDLDVDTTAPMGSSFQRGDVVTATWAQRVLTYVGSTSRPVPVVYLETHSGAIHTITYAHTGDITTWNRAIPGGTVWQDTQAAAIVTSQEAAAITVTNTAANMVTNNLGAQEVFNEGPLVATMTAAPLVSTLTAAAAVTTLTAASVVDTLTAAAAKVATFTVAPAILTVNVGTQTTISVPEDTTITVLSNRLTATEANLITARNDIAVMKNHISETDTHISQTDTRLSQVKADVGENSNWIHLIIALGI